MLEHKHLGNGSIILMHNGAKYTPAALEAIILGLKEKGYELVPISELIHKENYEMDHEGRQHVKEDSDNRKSSDTTGTPHPQQTTESPVSTPDIASKTAKKGTPMPHHAA